MRGESWPILQCERLHVPGRPPPLLSKVRDAARSLLLPPDPTPHTTLTPTPFPLSTTGVICEHFPQPLPPPSASSSSASRSSPPSALNEVVAAHQTVTSARTRATAPTMASSRSSRRPEAELDAAVDAARHLPPDAPSPSADELAAAAGDAAGGEGGAAARRRLRVDGAVCARVPCSGEPAKCRWVWGENVRLEIVGGVGRRRAGQPPHLKKCRGGGGCAPTGARRAEARERAERRAERAERAGGAPESERAEARARSAPGARARAPKF